jgi:hypothetical protein
MVIDDAGDLWTGSEPADIAEYLVAYTSTEDGYPATAFRQLVCPCGSNRFRLVRAGSHTQRTCAGCKQVRYIDRFGKGAGWKEAVAEEGSEPYKCVGCGGNKVNVCLGFADYARHPGYKDKPDSPLPDAVLWFFVGVRCAKCGTLGCFNDGKVGRGPIAESTFREIAGEQPQKGR